MSDTVALAVVAGIFGLLNILATAFARYLGWVQGKAADAKGAIATKRMDSLEVIAEETHKLVNSNMEAALKLTAELSRWKADNTKDSPDFMANERSAREAEEAYRVHVSKQKSIDRNRV